METQKISKDMKIVEIVEKNPEAAEILFEAGLACAGCYFSGLETLEQGCLGHGMDEEDIEEIVNAINGGG